MKKLFEIPVYSMSEDEFTKKYDKSFGNTQNLDELKSYMYPKGVWRYNQIIGYITISLDENTKDIVFEVYKYVGRIDVLSSKKKYIQNLCALGLHFPYTNLSNKEIISKCKEMICYISKDYFKGRFMDLTIFENLIDSIVLENIMKEN